MVRRPKAYWKAVLDYCFAGCLQAVLDEYAHVLVECAAVIARKARSPHISLRRCTTRLHCERPPTNVRDFEPDESNEVIAREPAARFALRFGDNRIDKELDAYRPISYARPSTRPSGPSFSLRPRSGRRASTSTSTATRSCIGTCPPIQSTSSSAKVASTGTRDMRSARTSPLRTRALRTTANADDPWEVLFAEGARHRSATENDLVPSWIFDCWTRENRMPCPDASVQSRRGSASSR